MLPIRPPPKHAAQTRRSSGEAAAARLASLSIALALAGLVLSEFLARRARAMLGG